MPVVTIGILSAESEQLDLLQTLIDATGAARSVLKNELADLDSCLRRVREVKPQVLVVDVPARSPAAAVSVIERLHAELPQMAIFASGDMTKRQIIVEVMRAGACEFLDRPPSTNSLMEALSRLGAGRRKGPDDPNRGRVITLVNAKGGCGATTIAVNLALALQSAHGNVALVDLGPLGHAALHMNLKPLFSVADALRNLHRLDASLLEGFMTRHSNGLHLLAGANAPVPVEPSTAEFARLFDMLVSHYRYVVVDTSSRLDATMRLVSNLSETVLLVAHADVASLWSASRVQQYLGETGGRDRVKLVLNRFRKIPGFNEADAESAAGAKLVWKIPNQYFAVSAAIDRGTPLMQQNHTEIARSFAGLAAQLTANDDEVKRSTWSLFKTV